MNDYIPIYEYAKLMGVTKQTIYRKIREGKIPQDKIKKVEKTVTRFLIDSSLRIEIRKKP